MSPDLYLLLAYCILLLFSKISYTFYLRQQKNKIRPKRKILTFNTLSKYLISMFKIRKKPVQTKTLAKL